MNFNRRTQDIKKITSFQDPNLYKFLSPNVTVWVKLKTPEESLNLFKKALIITVDLMKNLVKVRFLDPHPSKTKVNEEYNIKDVYKVNTLYRPQGFDDMGNMLLVNEAEILWNLRLRFLENIQYSYIGPILLFMNSKNLPPGLFSKTNINFYQKMLQKDEVLNSKDFFPHIYGILSDAIKGLRVKDQVLIFHGQNNSGKSLNFAKAAEFLGVLNKEREIKKGIDDFLDISDSMHLDMDEELVLSSLFITEIFTNVQTASNDFSSRCIKIFSFLFEKKTLKIKGISLSIDFLEKKRVAFPSNKESNFLVFYIMIFGFPENVLNGLHLKKDHHYELLNLSHTPPPSLNFSNKDYYKSITDSLSILGITLAEIQYIFKLLASILHLGEKNPSLNHLQDLLGLPEELLDSVITHRKVFQIWLYSRIVLWIKRKINGVFGIEFDKVNTKTFSILYLIDEFGVEGKSEENPIKEIRGMGFSELKSNYLYEKFQQIYLKETFKNEEVNFLQEGLTKNCDFLDFRDNLPIIELLEKKSFGLFRFLQTQPENLPQNPKIPSVKPNIREIESNNLSNTVPLKYNLIEKNLEEIMARDTNDIFFTGKMTQKQHSFVLLHSFHEVYYCLDNLTFGIELSFEQQIHQSIFKKELIKDQTSPQYNKLIPLISQKVGPWKEKGGFIDSFLLKVEKIMDLIEKCEIRFVFCLEVEEKQSESIKNKNQGRFDSQKVLSQMQILEIENLIIRYKDEFQHKIEYPKFYQLFKDLLGNSVELYMKEKVSNSKNLCENILQSNLLEVSSSKALFGKTKVFLNEELFQKLEGKKILALSKKNSRNNEKFFSSTQFKINLKLNILGLKQVMKVIIEFQKRFRAQRLRKKFLQKKRALNSILRFHERYTLRSFLKKYHSQVVSLALKTKRMKKLIMILQIVRNSYLRTYFHRYYDAVRLEVTYFTKKNQSETVKSKQVKHNSTILQADVILKQLYREKTLESKKNSIISDFIPQNQNNASLDKLLKNNLMKNLENKSFFTRLMNKKKIPQSSFTIDESLCFDSSTTPLLEENKGLTITKDLIEMIESGEFIQNRRVCITAKSFLEYENRSTKSLLEEYLEYKFKKEPISLEFDQLPLSNDVYLDLDGLDQKFLEELKKEYFEETWKKIISEKTLWGKKQKYTKIMSFQAKLIENPLLDLPSKFKEQAKRMFKYVLQYSEDRKMKFTKGLQLKKLLKLLLEENHCGYLHDEIYLQILKQLSNNPNQNSIKNLMNLLSIISSLIPPSYNILMSVLNFVYLKALLNQEFNEEIAMKSRFIFVRVAKIFEIGARKLIPIEAEIACIEKNKQIYNPVFFLSGEHILVGCESYSLVKDLKQTIITRFKISPSRSLYLGIYFIVKADKNQMYISQEEGFLEEKNKIMDVLSKWDTISKINSKSDFSFSSNIYLKIRIPFDIETSPTNDDITLVYIQSVHDFLNDFFELTEKEVLSLASSKMAVDYGDFSEEKVRFLKINIENYIPKSILEKYSPEGWIDRILFNYLTLKTFSKTQAKQLFLSHLSHFEQFNAQVYKGKLIITEVPLLDGKGVVEKNERKIIWKKDSLVLEQGNKSKEKILYFDIERWGKVEKVGVFFQKKGDKGIYNILGDKYKDFEFLLRFFCNNAFNSNK